MTTPDPALAELDAALIALRRLWAGPARVSDPALGAVEMSTVWIVDALDRLGPPAETTVADLAAALDVAPSTASRLIDRAQAAGCVSRHRSERDTRRTVVAATPVGQSLARAARAARTAYLADVTDGWAADDRRTLSDLLGRLADAVRATPPHAAGGTAGASP